MKRLLVSCAVSANLIAACLLMQGCSKKHAAAPETQLPEEQPPVEVQPIEEPANGAKASSGKSAAPAAAYKPAAVETSPIDVQSVGGTTSYTVAKGDTISSIAYRYGVRWQDIIAVNPGISPNKLRVGQVIQLPGKINAGEARHIPGAVKTAPAATAAKTTAPKTSAAAPAVAAGPSTVYIVKKGDMLSGIAHKHGVKLAALRAANPKIKGDKIFVGQKLNVPAGSKVVTTAPAAKKAASAKATAKAASTKAPVVKSAKAAAKPAVKAAETTAPAAAVEAKTADAPAAAKSEVKAETKPAEGKAAASADKNPTYTVKEGEDVYAVAIRWGVSPTDIKTLNNLTSNELKAGQVLKLPSNVQQ